MYSYVALILSVGLSNLQYVDMSKMRNVFVVAISIFVGMALPHWVQTNSTQIQLGILLKSSTDLVR